MTRIIAIAAGCGLLALAWTGALAPLATGPFGAHMIMHVTVVSVAAPLIAIGFAGSAADPTVRWPVLAAPIPAMVLDLLVVWGWHVPLLHHVARSTLGGLVLEQASFLLVGLVLWLAAFGGRRLQRQHRTAAGVIALLTTSMHMTLLGALVTLAPRPLYAHGPVAADAAVLADQQVAGMVMLLGGATSYLAGGLFLVHRLLRGTRPSDPRRELDHAVLG